MASPREQTSLMDEDGKPTPDAGDDAPATAPKVPPLPERQPSQYIHEEFLRPFKFADWIVNKPCRVCGCIWLGLLLALGIDAALFEFSDGTNSRTYLIESDDYVTALDAQQLAVDEAAEKGSDATTTPQTDSDGKWTVFLMFELANPGNDPWILTKTNIDAIIAKEEEWLRGDDSVNVEWDNLCLVAEGDTSYDCQFGATSFARQVQRRFNDTWETTVTTADIKNYTLAVYAATQEKVDFEAYFDEGFKLRQTASFYRSWFKAGWPYPDKVSTPAQPGAFKESTFHGIDDDITDQQEWYVDYFEPWWDEYVVDSDADNPVGEMNYVLFSFGMWEFHTNEVFTGAFAWAFASILAVLGYSWFHLKSLCLALMAMGQILLSFPVAYFVYRAIFQITWFDQLSILIVFVLLGIGADDVFVFTDAWHQSVHFLTDPTDLTARMSFTYRRAAKAMLVTQVTTFFAFLATAINLVVPIRAFGVWAALVVAANYVLVVTLYPVMLLLWHKHIKPKERCFCCDCIQCGDVCQRLFTSKDPPNPERKESVPDVTAGGDGADGAPALPRQATVEEQSSEYRAVERFLGTTWAQFITRPHGRYGLLAFFAIGFAIGAYGASTIEKQDEPEEWFENDHYMYKSSKFIDNFNTGEEDGLTPVDVTWGIAGVDRDDTDVWDPDDYGVVEWDQGFDPSPVAAQQFLYDRCQELRDLGGDLTHSANSVTCVTDRISDYVNTRYNVTDGIYRAPAGSDQKTSYAKMLHDFSSDFDVVGGAYEFFAGRIYVERNGDQYTTRMLGFSVSANVEVTAASVELEEQRERWDAWVATVANGCPSDGNVCSPQHSSRGWSWLASEDAFVQGAIQGILIALPLAFVILILASGNWWVSVLATLDIIGVVVCELGLMAGFGWKFGVAESIAIVTIIGFSVDYVVHFANAYLECGAETRSERTAFALLTMGISVVAGACTTFVASIFLLVPGLIFFSKMGVLIMTTVALALLWALGWFVTMLAWIGPEHSFGQLPMHKLWDVVLCRKCRNKDGEKAGAPSPHPV